MHTILWLHQNVGAQNQRVKHLNSVSRFLFSMKSVASEAINQVMAKVPDTKKKTKKLSSVCKSWYCSH